MYVSLHTSFTDSYILPKTPNCFLKNTETFYPKHSGVFLSISNQNFFNCRKLIALIARVMQFVDFQTFPVQ